MKTIALLIALLPTVGALVSSGAELFPEWDRRAPGLVLTNVDIAEDSFVRTLMRVGQDLGIRTSACLTNDIHQPFTFRAKTCTASDVLDKVTATYDSLEWRQDRNTGIVWFLPRNGEASDWLRFRVRLRRNQPGLRMYTDVIHGLEAFSGEAIGSSRRGIAFLNAVDYTVDLPAGVLSLEEIFDLCQSSNPNSMFLLQLRGKYLAISLGGPFDLNRSKAIPPGLRLFWEIEAKGRDSEMLDPMAIVLALSSRDPHIRSAAEKVVGQLGFLVSIDGLLKTNASTEQKLWAANGILNAIVRDPQATTHYLSLQLLTSDETQNLLLSGGNPELAVLSAFQLARCSKGTDLLTKVLQKTIPNGKLLHVKSELFRMARESREIRDAIKGNRPRWRDLTADEIDQLISPDQMIFSAP